MANAPTVYLVDDDPGALRSLSWLISQAGLPFRAFCSGQEFLDAYRSQDPGCLVLDVRMPEMGGLQVQQRLSEIGARLPIIFVTAHGDVPTCARAFKGGAVDFLNKPVDGQVFLERIRKGLARGTRLAEIATRIATLTVREKEVMDMWVAGKTIKEIAGVTNVRTETIWKHRSSIFSKMRVENEVELVRLVNPWQDEHCA
jgi:two-component system, LuxR family, response regulator FixJ